MGAKYRDYSYTARRAHRRSVLFTVFIIVFIFSTYTIISTFAVKSYRFQTDSMAPEIALHDVLLITPIYNPSSAAKRGSVIVVSPPFSDKRSFLQRTVDSIVGFCTFQFFQPFKAAVKGKTENSIRRIVGMPGDTVYMENFILYIKTKDAEHFLTEFELTETDYDLEIQPLPDAWTSTLPFSGTYPKTVLKDNEYFVLCDNRMISDDSRLWGPIDGKTRIYGTVLFKYWPLKKIKPYK